MNTNNTQYLKKIIEIDQRLKVMVDEVTTQLLLDELLKIYRDLIKNYHENAGLIQGIENRVMDRIYNEEWNVKDDHIMFCVSNFPVFGEKIVKILYYRNQISASLLEVVVKQHSGIFNKAEEEALKRIIELMYTTKCLEGLKELFDKLITPITTIDNYSAEVEGMLLNHLLTFLSDQKDLIDHIRARDHVFKDMHIKSMSCKGAGNSSTYPPSFLYSLGLVEIARIYAENTLSIQTSKGYHEREKILGRPLLVSEISESRFNTPGEERALMEYLTKSPNINVEDFYHKLVFSLYQPDSSSKEAIDLYARNVKSSRFSIAFKLLRGNYTKCGDVLTKILSGYIEFYGNKTERRAPKFTEALAWCDIALNHYKLADRITIGKTNSTEDWIEFLSTQIAQMRADDKGKIFNKLVRQLVGDDILEEATHLALKNNPGSRDRIFRTIPQSMVRGKIRALKLESDLSI